MQDMKNTKSSAGRGNSDGSLPQAAPSGPSAPFLTHEEAVRLIDRAIRRAEWPSPPPKPRVLSPWEAIQEIMVKRMQNSLNSDSVSGETLCAPDKKGG